MSSISPESLIQQWFGELSANTGAAIFSDPLYVPYDHLSTISGWVVWLGHPPVPDWVHLFPAPDHLLWGDPHDALGVVSMVAADYAVRRGAENPERAVELLSKESPIAVIVPGDLHKSLVPILEVLAEIGIPVLRGSPQSEAELEASAPSFRFRAVVHAVDLSRPHDPAYSFETFVPIDSVGGNSLSSFIVHNEGERDEVTITGELSSRVGIEIGVGNGEISVEQSLLVEIIAAEIPGFLSGITSEIAGHSLAIGWRENPAPDPTIIGEAFRLYLKALLDVSFVDVRISFAPPKGRSAKLTDMRARAAAFRTYRSAVIAGDPDPLAAVDNQRSSEPD